MEGEQDYTPEQIDELNWSRRVSDHDLWQKGASTGIDSQGRQFLEASIRSKENAHSEMVRDLWIKKLKSLELKPGESRKIKLTYSLYADKSHAAQTVELTFYEYVVVGDKGKDLLRTDQGMVNVEEIDDLEVLD